MHPFPVEPELHQRQMIEQLRLTFPDRIAKESFRTISGQNHGLFAESDHHVISAIISMRSRRNQMNLF